LQINLACWSITNVPTIFKREIFDFGDAEIPTHMDEYPQTADIDPGLHHIEGLIPEDGDFVWLAINIESRRPQG
jgi:hypothetical protein